MTETLATGRCDVTKALPILSARFPSHIKDHPQ